jgi:hypothetical protein
MHRSPIFYLNEKQEKNQIKKANRQHFLHIAQATNVACYQCERRKEGAGRQMQKHVANGFFLFDLNTTIIC